MCVSSDRTAMVHQNVLGRDLEMARGETRSALWARSARIATVAAAQALFWALPASYAAPTRAGSLELLEGADNSICVQYKGYVEFQERNAKAKAKAAGNVRWQEMLMCTRQILASSPGFAQPTWREINPSEHLTLAQSVITNMTYDLAQGQPSTEIAALIANPRHARGMKSAVLANYRSGRDKWWLAEADIDNDGIPDRLVKFKQGPCNDYPPESLRYEIVVMVLNEMGDEVSTAATRRVVKGGAAGTLNAMASSFDVFQYRGKTYLDHWRNEGERDGKATSVQTLSVYLNENGQRALVCRLRVLRK